MSRALIAPPYACAIAEEVRAANGIPREVFYGPRRGSVFLSSVRRLAAIRIFGAGYSTPEIGAALKRDHSSVVAMLQGGKSKFRRAA